jgi:alkyl hydroperoxide reductase subunit AhpC
MLESSLSYYSIHSILHMFVQLKFLHMQTKLVNSEVNTLSFLEYNTEVLAISVDSHFSHLAWRKAKKEDGGLGPIDIPLVSDITKDIAVQYGVLVTD